MMARNPIEPWNPTPEELPPDSRLPPCTVVLLDGTMVVNAIDADPAAGVVTMFDIDEEGYIVRDEESGEPALIEAKGKVEIVPDTSVPDPPNLNTGMPWRESCIEDLKAGVARGESLDALADFHCRTRAEIRHAAAVHGLTIKT
jgi:hypothetical protein